MSSLLEIQHELKAINTILQEMEDGDTEARDLRPDVLAWLADTTQREDDKLTSYANLITLLEAELATAKELEKAYKKKAENRTARIKWLKDVITENLDATGRKKVQTSALQTISICANGGSLPVVYNFPPDSEIIIDHIPEQFVSVVKRPNNIAVRKALEAGEVLEFAYLGERGTHVRIT